MKIEDFEKLKTGDKLNKDLLDGTSVRRTFVGVIAGKVMTCLEDGNTPCAWGPRELSIFSIYVPPKKKVKLYMCLTRGEVSRRLYTKDLSQYWDGTRLIPSYNIGNNAEWIILESTFIEVEV